MVKKKSIFNKIIYKIVSIFVVYRMILKNKSNYMKNLFEINFENISKYLMYDDYITFYHMYAPKNIISLKRKCFYCNKIPICPVFISYNYNLRNIICKSSAINPVCYSCIINNWIGKFNQLSYRNKLMNGFICPHRCCKYSYSNRRQIIIHRRDENLLNNFSVSWKDIIPYYKCNFCDQVFKNKTHKQIYQHYRKSICRIIIKKIKYGWNEIYSDSDLDSDSDSECYIYE